MEHDAESNVDLDSDAAIRRLVENFYAQVLRHPSLHVYFDPAALRRHLSIIEAYWQRMLLGGKRYRRNMVNVHRDIHRRLPIAEADFGHWLMLFTATVDADFAGPKAERAKFLARTIIVNLKRLLLTP